MEEEGLACTTPHVDGGHRTAFYEQLHGATELRLAVVGAFQVSGCAEVTMQAHNIYQDVS